MDGRCLRAVRARLRATSLRAERGGVLVEVMVSAVILVVVAGATFKAIDAASSASAKTKTKSVATSLAQKYMDDLRSQDPIKLSAAKTGGRHRGRRQHHLHVRDQRYWVRDATQDKSCDGNPGDYMKLSVTVTWTGMTASRQAGHRVLDRHRAERHVRGPGEPRGVKILRTLPQRRRRHPRAR